MNHLIFKRAIGTVWRCIPKPASRRVILIYHAIGDPPAVSRKRFEEQIKWLAKNASFVTLDQISRQEVASPHKLQVCVTFDDGYLSVFEEALPILKAHDATATVYINPGLMDSQLRSASRIEDGHYPGQWFMNWQDVRELHFEKWTIGSHGMTHVDLTALSPQEVLYQLTESRRQIEDTLCCECHHFAYTWGRNCAALRQHVANVGYISATSGMHGPVTIQSDPYSLPRIDVRTDYTLSDFRKAVQGDWDFMKAIQQLRKP